MKDGYEDYQRHKTDYETNFVKKSSVLKGQGMKEIIWKDISVGEVIYLEDKSEVREKIGRVGIASSLFLIVVIVTSSIIGPC